MAEKWSGISIMFPKDLDNVLKSLVCLHPKGIQLSHYFFTQKVVKKPENIHIQEGGIRIFEL